MEQPFNIARQILKLSKEVNISPCLVSRQTCGRKLDSFLLFCINNLLSRWSFNQNEAKDDMEVSRELNIQNHPHIIVSCVQAAIDSFTLELRHSSYSKQYLPPTRAWYEKELVPFIEEIYETKIAHLPDLSKTLSDYILTSISRIRTLELFEIIADYPDSNIAIKELKDTSQSKENQTNIGRAFRQIICKRLLHQGASTNQILDMYISVVRAFRVLDSSDLLLNYVALPIREYLKSRKDTVHCVVSSLAQGRESDLHNELKQGTSLEFGQDEDFEEAVCLENWTPRKRNTELADTGLSGLDVLALLVSIYGSTDVFVKEYRQLLGSNLLQNLSYQTDKDLITLEHLKKRFGEESLHSCEVMLHDLEDSKRVNIAVASHLALATQKLRGLHELGLVEVPDVDLAIVSDNYWPSLESFDCTGLDAEDSGFKLHGTAQKWLDRYEQAYQELKKPRKLEVYPLLGQVQLTLDFENQVSRSFSVSPLQATLIMNFHEKKSVTLSELAQLTDLDPPVVRQKMAFWIEAGVIDVETIVPVSNGGSATDAERDTIVFVCLDFPRAPSSGYGDLPSDAMIVEESGGYATATLSSQRSKIYYSNIEAYIKGLLANTDSMTLERLHQMLKLLSAGNNARDQCYDMNMIELHDFLQSLVNQDVVDFIDGAYVSVVKRK